jgi:hypothetical protein
LLRATTAYRSPRGAAIQRFGVRNVDGVTTVFGVGYFGPPDVPQL